MRVIISFYRALQNLIIIIDNPLEIFLDVWSHNIIYQNLWAIVLGAPMLLMLGIVPRSMTHLFICFGILIVLFLMILLIQYRDRIFRRKQ